MLLKGKERLPRKISSGEGAAYEGKGEGRKKGHGDNFVHGERKQFLGDRGVGAESILAKNSLKGDILLSPCSLLEGFFDRSKGRVLGAPLFLYCDEQPSWHDWRAMSGLVPFRGGGTC